MKIATIAALAALGLLLGQLGCATAPTQEELASRASTDERLQMFTTVIRGMREDPFAGEVAPMLDRAEVWVQRAEALRARPEDERALMPVLLEAIEGQLVQIQAHFSKRRAEADLEERRGTYEAQMKKIEDIRQRNRQVLDDAEAAP